LLQMVIPLGYDDDAEDSAGWGRGALARCHGTAPTPSSVVARFGRNVIQRQEMSERDAIWSVDRERPFGEMPSRADRRCELAIDSERQTSHHIGKGCDESTPGTQETIGLRVGFGS